MCTEDWSLTPQGCHGDQHPATGADMNDRLLRLFQNSEYLDSKGKFA